MENAGNGKQEIALFSKLNPLNYVPVLVNEGKVIADSFAIILYLEEKYPQHPLLPQDIHKKAINFQAANIVAANIQPFQNPAVLADLFLAPQIHIAINWFKLDMAEFPTLRKLNEAYEQLPAFRAAMPDMQPDANWKTEMMKSAGTEKKRLRALPIPNEQQTSLWNP
ncbi:Glutathione S-transferase zeta-1 [Asimina triloba]